MESTTLLVKENSGDKKMVVKVISEGKINSTTKQIMSEMTFDSFKTARDLFDGKINAIAAVGLGQVRIGGMVSQVDNVNRILDRVALYMA